MLRVLHHSLLCHGIGVDERRSAHKTATTSTNADVRRLLARTDNFVFDCDGMLRNWQHCLFNLLQPPPLTVRRLNRIGERVSADRQLALAGVLYTPEGAVHGAAAALASLRAAGKRCFFVTNNAEKTREQVRPHGQGRAVLVSLKPFLLLNTGREQLQAKLLGKGIEAEVSEIFGAAYLTGEHTDPAFHCASAAFCQRRLVSLLALPLPFCQRLTPLRMMFLKPATCSGEWSGASSAARSTWPGPIHCRRSCLVTVLCHCPLPLSFATAFATVRCHCLLPLSFGTVLCHCLFTAFYRVSSGFYRSGALAEELRGAGLAVIGGADGAEKMGKYDATGLPLHHPTTVLSLSFHRPSTVFSPSFHRLPLSFHRSFAVFVSLPSTVLVIILHCPPFMLRDGGGGGRP